MKYGGDRSDPYLDKETDILRNRLGLRTQAALDRAESTMSFLRTVELHEHPVKGSFDLAHLQATHKRLFDDLYNWAGKIRQVEIQKGDTIFARRLVINSAAQQLFGQLAKEDFLRHLDADPFSERAAHFLGEINVLHPFRDGSGRALREFIGQLARSAGHSIDWSGISRAT
jgi:cell filamentation protein